MNTKQQSSGQRTTAGPQTFAVRVGQVVTFVSSEGPHRCISILAEEDVHCPKTKRLQSRSHHLVESRPARTTCRTGACTPWVTSRPVSAPCGHWTLADGTGLSGGAPQTCNRQLTQHPRPHRHGWAAEERTTIDAPCTRDEPNLAKLCTHDHVKAGDRHRHELRRRGAPRSSAKEHAAEEVACHLVKPGKLRAAIEVLRLEWVAEILGAHPLEERAALARHYAAAVTEVGVATRRRSHIKKDVILLVAARTVARNEVGGRVSAQAKDRQADQEVDEAKAGATDFWRDLWLWGAGGSYEDPVCTTRAR